MFIMGRTSNRILFECFPFFFIANELWLKLIPRPEKHADSRLGHAAPDAVFLAA